MIGEEDCWELQYPDMECNGEWLVIKHTLTACWGLYKEMLVAQLWENQDEGGHEGPGRMPANTQKYPGNYLTGVFSDFPPCLKKPGNAFLGCWKHLVLFDLVIESLLSQ